jgi:hypothetical protein
MGWSMSESEFMGLVELVSGPYFRFVDVNLVVRVTGGYGTVFTRYDDKDELIKRYLVMKHDQMVFTRSSDYCYLSDWVGVGDPELIDRMRGKFKEAFGDA